MHDVEHLRDLVAGKRVAILTGAGVSTDSGIPDYGGLHSRTRATRIQYKAFVNEVIARKRYWARSAVGWARVANAQPNNAHRIIGTLETVGCINGVITQNVDGLHHRGGSRRIVELHGTLSRVRCLECDHLESRAALQERLLSANPFLRAEDAPLAPAAPDGDAELHDERIASMVVPECERCRGLLKPDVVFFGENVPRARVDAAWEIYREADMLMAVGTSLAVFSGYRFVQRAAREGKPVAIVNGAETRGDEDAAVVVRGRVADVLLELAQDEVHNATG